MVQLLSHPVIASPPPTSQIHPFFTIRITNLWRCNYSNPQKPNRTQNFNFNFDDEVFTDDSLDQDEAFGSKSSNTQKRIWWSDANFFDDIDDDEDEFPAFEDSFGWFSWIPKIFKVFGWMVPAIFIYMVLGTGTNAIFMALALPLAQSAFSLVIDTLWNNPNDSPRPKPRTKRRSYPRAANNVATSKEKVQNTANEAKSPNGERKKPNFGGWDELDKQVRSEKVPLMTQIRKVNERSRQKRSKLSRRVTKREKPLVLRLLIAIFPFLGSWTKLL